MQTVEKTEYPALKRLGNQVGYGIAIGLSALLLYVVQNLEEWDVLPFLTDEFGEVVPWISASLILGILAYTAYIAFDDRTVRSIGELLTDLVAIAVTWKVFSVFPFDFTAYDFPWEVLTRFVLIVAIVGSAVGAVTQVVNLINPRANT